MALGGSVEVDRPVPLLPLATGEKKTLFSMMTSLAVWTLTPMNWLPAAGGVEDLNAVNRLRAGG